MAMATVISGPMWDDRRRDARGDCRVASRQWELHYPGGVSAAEQRGLTENKFVLAGSDQNISRIPHFPRNGAHDQAGSGNVGEERECFRSVSPDRSELGPRRPQDANPMSTAEVLRTAHAAGIELSVDADDLLLDASSEPPAALLDMLRQHKAGVVELLRRGLLGPLLRLVGRGLASLFR